MGCIWDPPRPWPISFEQLGPERVTRDDHFIHCYLTRDCSVRVSEDLLPLFRSGIPKLLLFWHHYWLSIGKKVCALCNKT